MLTKFKDAEGFAKVAKNEEVLDNKWQPQHTTLCKAS
jgi:hypothetical protein